MNDTPKPKTKTEPSPGEPGSPEKRRSGVQKSFKIDPVIEGIQALAVRVERIDAELAAALDMAHVATHSTRLRRKDVELLRSDVGQMKREVESLTSAVLVLIGRVNVLEDEADEAEPAAETVDFFGRED